MKKELRIRLKELVEKKSIANASANLDNDFIATHLMEECAELIQAINKIRRLNSGGLKKARGPLVDNLLEDVADVQIGIEELLGVFLKEEGNKDSYNKAVDRKLSKKEKYFEEWTASML